MFHHRLSLTGTDDVLTAAGASLLALGATPVGADVFITSVDRGVDVWDAFIQSHPRLRLAVDVFEELEDEFVQAVVTCSGTAVLSQQSVLPEQFGCFDEDGKPLPAERVTAAAHGIARERLAHNVGFLSSHLDDALTMAKALGRFCMQVEGAIFDRPSGADLDAVREIAVFAWWTAVAEHRNGTPGELEFDHALTLTQATVQAGREELWDYPGRASWMCWAASIIAAASEVIETGCAPDRSPDGHLPFAARSLLTTCIQTLALFEPHRENERAREDSNL